MEKGFTRLWYVSCRACREPVAIIRDPVQPDHWRGVGTDNAVRDPENVIQRLAQRLNVPSFVIVGDGTRAVRDFPEPAVEVAREELAELAFDHVCLNN